MPTCRSVEQAPEFYKAGQRYPLDKSQETDCAIRYVEIYQADTAIYLLNNWNPKQKNNNNDKKTVLLMRIIGSLSSDVFERHTSTGSEPFSLLVSLYATVFVLPSAQKFVQNHGSSVQKVHFRLTCVAQKRRCLSSPLSFPALKVSKFFIDSYHCL